MTESTLTATIVSTFYTYEVDMLHHEKKLAVYVAHCLARYFTHADPKKSGIPSKEMFYT